MLPCFLTDSMVSECIVHWGTLGSLVKIGLFNRKTTNNLEHELARESAADPAAYRRFHQE